MWVKLAACSTEDSRETTFGPSYHKGSKNRQNIEKSGFH